ASPDRRRDRGPRSLRHARLPRRSAADRLVLDRRPRRARRQRPPDRPRPPHRPHRQRRGKTPPPPEPPRPARPTPGPRTPALPAHAVVREAAALPAPDERWGQVGVAWVATTAAESELRAFLRDRIAKFKVPARFIVLDELPRNAAGKVDRKRLQSAG